MITKINCYYAKCNTKNKRKDLSLYTCALVKTSPDCEGCIFFKDLSSKEDMLSIARNQAVLDLYNGKHKIKGGYEKVSLNDD